MRISVVTVCLNASATIEGALKSIHKQTYQPKEHIVVDGASTDGTIEIARRHADRIATVISEPDRGLYYAMNKGNWVGNGRVCRIPKRRRRLCR